MVGTLSRCLASRSRIAASAAGVRADNTNTCGVLLATGAVVGGYIGTFVGYLVLDAWIANTDRHHQNWALLQTQGAKGVTYSMCPSFDHASSLGRELPDEKRRTLLAAGIDRYRHHRLARGAIYWETGDRHPLHQMELVRRIERNHPELVRPWLSRLEGVAVDEWVSVVHRVPETWMSTTAKEFAASLIEANRKELLKCSTA